MQTNLKTFCRFVFIFLFFYIFHFVNVQPVRKVCSAYMRGSHVQFFKILYLRQSFFFSKKAGMYSILECYMNGSLNLAGSTALHFGILQPLHFSL